VQHPVPDAMEAGGGEDLEQASEPGHGARAPPAVVATSPRGVKGTATAG
jgi:hypothetical protein